MVETDDTVSIEEIDDINLLDLDARLVKQGADGEPEIREALTDRRSASA